MKKILLLILPLLAGCTSENILNLQEEGFLNFNGKLLTFQESKVPVPSCADSDPISVRYRLLNPEGIAFEQIAPITLSETTFQAVSPVSFPANSYVVDEISLLDNNGNITHTVPTTADPRFNFAMYVTKPIPFNLEIIADETLIQDVMLLCYTEAPLDEDPMLPNGNIVSLITVYFYISSPNCIDSVVMEVAGYDAIVLPIFDSGLYTVAIPADFSSFNLSAFVGDIAVDVRENVTEYNVDGIQDDIFFFGPNCD